MPTKKLAIEALEWRVLLAVDISSVAELAMADGLNDLKTWTAGLDDLSDFTQPLPITSRLANRLCLGCQRSRG